MQGNSTQTNGLDLSTLQSHTPSIRPSANIITKRSTPFNVVGDAQKRKGNSAQNKGNPPLPTIFGKKLQKR